LRVPQPLPVADFFVAPLSFDVAFFWLAFAMSVLPPFAEYYLWLPKYYSYHHKLATKH